MMAAGDFIDRRLKESIEVLAGQRGDPKRRAVTFGDLDAPGGVLRDLSARTRAAEQKAETGERAAVVAHGEATEAAAQALAALNAATAIRLGLLARIAANAIRTGNGDAGTGDWSQTTTSTDLPPGAPAGSLSLVHGSTAAESPAYNEDIKGHTFPITGWIKKASGQVNFRPRGSSLNDPAQRSLIALESTAAASVTATGAWQQVDVTIKATGTTTHWTPGFSQSGTCLAYGMSWQDITGIVSEIEKLETSVEGGLTATVNSQKIALADLEGNAAAFIGLTAEVVGNAIAGIRALAFVDAATGTSGALLELLGDVIAEGTVAVGKLVVGLQKNLLVNTRFRHGLDHWKKAGSSGPLNSETTLSLRAAGSTFAGGFHPTMQLYQAGTGTGGQAQVRWFDTTSSSGATAAGVPVKPGDVLEASAYIVGLRCDVKVGMTFRDSAGGFLLTSYSAPVSASGDSANPDLWPRPFRIATAPAGAAYAEFVVDKGPTTTGGDSRAIIHKPMLATTHAGASLPSPFSDEGTTLVGPNGILTPEMAVAGLAVFGGSLQSDNYVPNGTVPSWYIHKDGTAKFINLIVSESITLGGVTTRNLADFAATKVGSVAGFGNTSITVSHLPGSTLIVFVSSGSALASVSTNKSRHLRLVLARDGSTIGTEEQDPTIEDGGRLPPLTFFRVIPNVAGLASTFSATLSGAGVSVANTYLAIFESKR